MFYRTGRGVTLTEMGDDLIHRVRALLDNAGQLVEDAQAYGRAPSGQVTVAALPSLMPNLAPQLYKHIQKHAPQIRLHVIEGFSDQIERWLSEGTADIGLLARYRQQRRGQNEELFRARLVLMRSCNVRPLPDVIAFSALAGLPLVLPSHRNALRVLIEETARKQAVALNIVMEADSLVAQREVVRTCDCYSVVAAQAVDASDADAQVLFSEIENPSLIRFVTVSATVQRPLSRASRVVLQAIRSFWPGPGTLVELAHGLR
ncbi:LysR substrate-binding domain-containing protein, partial [Rhizobiaceae sp. 2RAB30]